MYVNQRNCSLNIATEAFLLRTTVRVCSKIIKSLPQLHAFWIFLFYPLCPWRDISTLFAETSSVLSSSLVYTKIIWQSLTVHELMIWISYLHHIAWFCVDLAFLYLIMVKSLCSTCENMISLVRLLIVSFLGWPMKIGPGAGKVSTTPHLPRHKAHIGANDYDSA